MSDHASPGPGLFIARLSSFLLLAAARTPSSGACCHDRRLAMERMNRLTELRENGTMRWSGEQHAWVAEPDAVVSALAHDGFEEYKREVARCGHDRAPAGGVW